MTERTNEMKKAIFITILAAVMLLTMGSCSETETETSKEQTAAPVSPTETPEETETTLMDVIPSTLPDVTFDGASFNFLKWSDGGAWDLTEFAAEEYTGELLNDAVFERNMLIEEKYQVAITSENHSQPIDNVKHLVAGGDTTYQVVTDWPSRMANAIAFNALYDINSMPNLDLEAVWWDHNARTAYTIKGKMYFTTGDILLFDKQRVFCMIFNSTLADMLQLDNLYDTVREGKWTADLFNRYCELAASDLNGNGLLGDIDDCYGLIGGSYSAMPYLLFGLDNSYSKPNDDGELEFALASEHTINSIELIGKTIFDKNLSIQLEDIVAAKSINDREFFQERRGLFNYTVTHVLRLMDMDDAYGVIPQPKFDESQPKYITCGGGDFSAALGIPSNLDETQAEMTGILLEAMSALSHETTYPAFIEGILMTKKAPDKESSEMLHLIYSNIHYDLFDIFKVGQVDQMLQTCLSTLKGENVMHIFEANAKKIEKAYSKLMESIG